ncbi:acyl-CoA thioesterase [Arthrobacter globiformis]|uniref:acyl-CoA thioesterase n=1 Tax=Arthrobacter globiformis TaxID=1665 RepID=UPI00397BDC48
MLGDVDSAQVIYFASVFRWHEYNMSEWLAERFTPLRHLLESGHGLPVVSCSADYGKPILQDDVLELESWVSGVSRSSFLFSTNVLRDAVHMGTVTTRHVWTERDISGAFQSKPLPEALQRELNPL